MSNQPASSTTPSPTTSDGPTSSRTESSKPGSSKSGSSKIGPASVAGLRKGDRLNGQILLVEISNFKQTRNGKYFIQLALRDRTGSVRAVRWEASRELYNSFSQGDFVRVDGRVEEFQQNLQVVVDGIERVDDDSVPLADFLPVAARELDDMEEELLGVVAGMQNGPLKDLLLRIVTDSDTRNRLKRCPAGKSVHHAYIGGLLEHILSLIAAARQIAKLYPQLDGDLLVAAAVLHDIGKIEELSYDRTFSYTDSGQLVGHIGLGMILVSEKAKSVEGFPPELLNHLLHIIASHHGEPEHGALKTPMSAEAIAFHFIDNLDAKMAMLVNLRQEMENAEAATEQSRNWTEFKPNLGKKIYFP